MRYCRTHQCIAAFGVSLFLASGVVAQVDLAPGATQVQELPPGLTPVNGSFDKESILMTDAIWAVFMTATIIEDKGIADGTSTLEGMGFDPTSADVLFQHMRSSVEAKKHSDLERRADICGRREQIVTREDIVWELDTATRASDAERELFIAQVAQLVGAEANSKLLEQADKMRSSISTLKTEPAAFFAAAPASEVSAALKRLCDPRPPPDSINR